MNYFEAIAQQQMVAATKAKHRAAAKACRCQRWSRASAMRR